MIKAIKGDSLQEIQKLEDCSLGAILTDPPFLYLKNQKLERAFDEPLFFKECYRVLKKDGLIAIFGRGESFYRWCTLMKEVGFKFKEELIWDKGHSTSPLMAISRVHETIAIFAKGKGKINKVKVPYLEMKNHDLDSIIQDIKRLKTAFGNSKSLQNVIEYLEKNYAESNIKKVHKHLVSQSKLVKNICRCVSVMQAINEGMNEKTIIKETRNHYNSIHPTEKPVRLLERILGLISKEGDLVADFFAGSFSCAEACFNIQRNFIGFEIDDEYFELGNNRVKKLLENPNLFT